MAEKTYKKKKRWIQKDIIENLVQKHIKIDSKTSKQQKNCRQIPNSIEKKMDTWQKKANCESEEV